jgi:hypothetical protein
MMVLGITSLIEAGKYETLKTPAEELAEELAEKKAKDLALLKRNIGRQFYAQPIKNYRKTYSTGPEFWYPQFSETAKKDSRKFRVLEKEEFSIKDFIVGEIETTYTVQTWYRREIILRVQFKSGKIGFIALSTFKEDWLGSVALSVYESYWHGDKNLKWEKEESLIVAKSEDFELDKIFIELAKYKGFSNEVW